MNPRDFEDSNKVLGKPENMTDDECVSLHVHDSGTEVTSVWQPTEAEIEKIVQGEPVALSIFTMAGSHPPIRLYVPGVNYE